VSVLRDATEADVDVIRTWRNHPKVRQVSLNTAEIAVADHLRWWRAVSVDPARKVLIFEYEGTPSGVVNFSGATPGADGEWGFFLDTDGLEARGALLAAWMELEKAAVAYGFDVLDLARMGGWTLAWNTQVLALHRRFGFVEVPERRRTLVIDGAEQEVAWTELSVGRYRARQRPTSKLGNTPATTA
jgi:UDP-4-amino-4,6-dideoxy-N-acetyl-beta-L-altrosamine N-acetyltransferase